MIKQQDETINKLKDLLAINSISLPADIDQIRPPGTADIEVIDTTGGQRQLLPESNNPKPDNRSSSPDTNVDFDDPRTGVEFILALEQPCLPHIHIWRGAENEDGHLLQLQSSLLGVDSNGQKPMAAGPAFSWDLSIPRNELKTQLDRLLGAAASLNLEGELTPIMCWHRLIQMFKQSKLSRNKLNTLQDKLVEHSHCRGYVPKDLRSELETHFVQVWRSHR